MSQLAELEMSLTHIASEITKIDEEQNASNAFYMGEMKIVIEFLVNGEYKVRWELYFQHRQVMVDIVYGNENRDPIDIVSNLDAFVGRLSNHYGNIIMNTIRYYIGQEVTEIEFIDLSFKMI